MKTLAFGKGKTAFSSKQAWLLILCAAASLAVAGASVAQSSPDTRLPFGEPSVTANLVTWTAVPGYRSLLTVAGPSDTWFQREFGHGKTPAMGLAELGETSEAGEISYSLRLLSDIDLREIEQLTSPPDAALAMRRAEARVAAEEVTQKGGWVLTESGFQPPTTLRNEDLTPPEGSAGLQTKTQSLDLNDEDLTINSTDVDIIMNDTGGEQFSFSINEAGTNDFALQTDQNGINTGPGAIYPLVIQNSLTPAADDALVIDETGDIGFGTNMPVAPLHIVDSFPEIRLEDNSGTVATWNLVANDSGFQIEEGNDEILTLSPGAPDGALHLDGSGNFGINEAAPDSMLTVTGGATRDAKIQVDETGDPVRAQRSLLALENNGTIRVEYKDISAGGATWFTKTSANKFFITKSGQGNLFFLDSSGNINITGVINEGSARSSKTAVVELDAHSVLSKVAALPLSTWQYKTDATGARHLGPMAEDFHQAFGLGSDEHRIAAGDRAGVALAAVQALHQTDQDLRKSNQELKETLEARINALQQENEALRGASAQLHQANTQLQERLDRLDLVLTSLVAERQPTNQAAP